ncbi:poly(A)-binding protein binding protein [Stylosanthes scabra]|uniref:Poly(A)-binding protein binding protein n=1 Tax=Stylosanthes scabra TaxID=79078 RepID=A0ABU6Y8H2_9FABA|nr:poly(A)-binding protein binding protein [Stylosanthes scabra]
MAASASANDNNAGRGGKGVVDFEDLLPVIAKKLGGEGLMRELQKGFEVLMDKEKKVITLESLKRNSALLGLHDLKEDEIVSMLKEGDIDGDGVLNIMDFCVLMFRLSPQLMEDSCFWLQHALQHELHSSTLFYY